MQEKLYGGRFEGGQDKFFEKFSESLHFDKRLFDVDITGSQAFARALESVGILSAEERATIVASFEAIREEGQDAAYFAGATDEDVHSFVIRKLKEKAGAVADKIHTGRSRNEQVSLDTRLWLRASIESTIEATLGLMRALLVLAQKYPQAVVPGYTHLRRAQAVLWPHYLLAYFEMFARDVERLRQAHARTNVLPLGSGALAGSAFPFDREAIAKDLQFASITRNSMDVSADRDFALDYMHAANLVMLHLSRLSEDWILYSSEEFGWLELSDGVTSGSSLMPQKKNPDSLELIRGKCGRVFGAYSALFVTMKGLPLTYNRDMQEDKEPLFEVAEQTIGCLQMAAIVAQQVVLRPEIPEKACAESWVVATDIAEALSRAGLPFHQSHQVAGRLVLHGIKTGKNPAEFTAAELQAFDARFTPDFVDVLRDPRHGMQTRAVPGGTAPASVAKALREALERIESL
ncbi:argininosuccinate lyase [Bryobacter aggregatus]|uniref:argininosuccinate lyase n=1 Tax=Bryobacter aggregatus TaxID=360054 RepID=UPI0004E0DF69|nr:argininosuccinate lyase [Bryobacter aggregatus]